MFILVIILFNDTFQLLIHFVSFHFNSNDLYVFFSCLIGLRNWILCFYFNFTVFLSFVDDVVLCIFKCGINANMLNVLSVRSMNSYHELSILHLWWNVINRNVLNFILYKHRKLHTIIFGIFSVTWLPRRPMNIYTKKIFIFFLLHKSHHRLQSLKKKKIKDLLSILSYFFAPFFPIDRDFIIWYKITSLLLQFSYLMNYQLT